MQLDRSMASYCKILAGIVLLDVLIGSGVVEMAESPSTAMSQVILTLLQHKLYTGYFLDCIGIQAVIGFLCIECRIPFILGQRVFAHCPAVSLICTNLCIFSCCGMLTHSNSVVPCAVMYFHSSNVLLHKIVPLILNFSTLNGYLTKYRLLSKFGLFAKPNCIGSQVIFSLVDSHNFLKNDPNWAFEVFFDIYFFCRYHLKVCCQVFY